LPENEAQSNSQGSIAALVGLVLFAMIAGNMITPTLYLYALELGASLGFIGLIASAASAARFLSRIPMGLLSDRFGRRPLICLGALGIVGSLLMLYLAPAPSQVLVAYVINTLAFMAVFTIGLTMASEINPSRRATGVSFFALSSSLAMFIAPGICSLLLLQLRIRETYLYASLIGLGGVLFSIRLASSPRSRSSLSIRRSLLSVFRDRNVRLAASLEGFFSLGYNSIMTFLPVYLSERFRFQSAEISFLVAIYSLAMVLIRLPLPMLLRRVDERTMTAVAFLEYALALMATPLGDSLVHFSVLLFAAGMAHGIIFPCMALVISKSSHLNLALANSVYLGVGDVVTIAAPPVLVLVIEALGYSPVYVVAAIGMMFGAVVAVSSERRLRLVQRKQQASM